MFQCQVSESSSHSQTNNRTELDRKSLVWRVAEIGAAGAKAPYFKGDSHNRREKYPSNYPQDGAIAGVFLDVRPEDAVASRRKNEARDRALAARRSRMHQTVSA